MCGRFVIEHPAEVIAGYFGLPAVAAFAPSDNVAPSRPVSRRVNRTVNDDPQCIAAVAP